MQQAALKGAVQELPANSGIGLANWNWKVVCQYVSERFGISLSRSTCLNYLRRLGFSFKRPKKRLLKADMEKREVFVAEYAALAFQAQKAGEKVFFADEAHFRADAELRGKSLKGEPALVHSSSPRYGEKASYYSAVCLETGEVEWMELEGNSNSGTSAAFLGQLRERHSGRLNVIWDNAPAHRGEAVREYLRTPGLNLGCLTCQVTVRTSMPVRRSGAGPGRRRPGTMPGDQGQGAGAGWQLPRWSGQPERRGKTPLPHRLAIKGRHPAARLPLQLSTPRKCTSHLGFSLVLQSQIKLGLPPCRTALRPGDQGPVYSVAREIKGNGAGPPGRC